MVEAGTAAPRIGSQEEPVTRAVVGAALASLVAGSTAPAPAQQALTRDQVLAALAVATPQAPADLTGRDLSGLDLSGVDFKRRSEEHTSELQSLRHLVCRLLLEKKKENQEK